MSQHPEDAQKAPTITGQTPEAGPSDEALELVIALFGVEGTVASELPQAALTECVKRGWVELSGELVRLSAYGEDAAWFAMEVES